MADELAKELLKRHSAMKAARVPFDPIYEQVADYMGPAFFGFSSPPSHPRTPQANRVDSSGKQASRVYASGLLSGVSSPFQRWFAMGLEDRERGKSRWAREWLQTYEQDLYDDLWRYGFYPCQVGAYHQSGLFGVQCIYVSESELHGIRFLNVPLRQIYIEENFQGHVDTVSREFELTARQAAQQFGEEHLSEKIKTARGKSDDDKRFTFVHIVMPVEDAPEKPRGTMLPFVSWYIEQGDARVVSTEGYHECPYIVTRSYRLPGTPYSYSPGTEALADEKMINEMKILILEAGQLSIAPPYWVPHDGFVGRISYKPRALNYYNASDRLTPDSFRPLDVGGDPRFSLELLQETKREINEAFFVDLFQTMQNRIKSGQTPTAREVSELAGEKMFLLAPMLIQQQTENHDALFNRIFALKMRRGELPPIPRELAGQSLKTEYVSPLALAQREEIPQRVLKSYQDAAMLAQIAGSEVLDNFNHDENLRAVLELRNFPQKGIKDLREVMAMRQKRAEGQAAIQRQQQAAAMLGQYKNLAAAPEEGSPAGAVLGGIGGA